MYSPDEYLETLYQETISLHKKAYDEQWRQELKNTFQDVLGRFQEEKRRFDYNVLEKTEMGEYTRIRAEIVTIHPMKMPIYVLIPKTKLEKAPGVVAIHGHGYGSKAVVGLTADGSPMKEEEYHKSFAVELAKRGVVVIVPELVGFGDRKLKRDRGIGKPTDNSCYMLASQLLLFGKTLAGLRVAECKRVIDFVMTLDVVDGSKIGCMGISGGGLVAAFTSALDERICATVISGYTNTFKSSIMSRRHCLDNYIPQILNYAEMPELIGLIAPRPLFIEAGANDHLFPVISVHEAIEKLRAIYHSFDATGHLQSHIFPGGHEICGEKSFDWLIAQLTCS